MTGVDQLRWRELILEVANDIIRLEGGPVPITEVRIVPGRDFFGLSHGTTMVLENGDIAVRVAVDRPPAEVGDTIIHELAHVLLGREHIDNPDHGPRFQEIYERLKKKYLDTVTGDLPR